MTKSRPFASSCVAVLLLAGCATQTQGPVSNAGTDSGSFTASDGAALQTAGAAVRRVRIYVDAVPVMEEFNGQPVINTTHAAGAGNAAASALQEAFNAHGFRAERAEFTSIGLGRGVRPVLVTSGPEAPGPGTLPVLLSPDLAGSKRGEWLGNLYAEVQAFAATGAARNALAATYLSPNLSRIEVFASLAVGDGSRAHLWVVAFDSRTGAVLWTGSSSETASVLDSAVATSLARRVAAGLPLVTGGG